MKRIVTIILFCFISLAMFSQDYVQSIGVRVINNNGISYKRNFDDANSFEAIFSCDEYLRFTFLKILNRPELIRSEYNLNFYYGYGGHIGADFPAFPQPFFKEKNPDSFGVGAGVDGIMGLEYELNNYPVTLSFDLMPNLDLRYPFKISGDMYNFSLSVRYLFKNF